MRQVKVSTPYDASIDYILIETMEDVDEYRKTLETKVTDTVTRLIRSKVDITRWDHMLARDDEGGVMSGAIMSAHVKGTNPIYEVGTIADKKINAFERLIRDGECILLNSSGGYCTLSDTYHTILESDNYVEVPEVTVVINEDTKYINLENDADLEQHTIDYLSKVDPNYSYITRLRNYDIDELIDIFGHFTEAGGEVAYIYTTGMDVQQMWDYSEAIIKSNIKRVEFEFNAGQSEDHDKIIAFLQGKKIVTVLKREL